MLRKMGVSIRAQTATAEARRKQREAAVAGIVAVLRTAFGDDPQDGYVVRAVEAALAIYCENTRVRITFEG